MRIGVRLSLFLSSGAIKKGSQKRREQPKKKSSIAFVTEDDGDPSGKTIGEGLYHPSLFRTVVRTQKRETGACKGHIGYKRRQNENKTKKKKTHERAGKKTYSPRRSETQSTLHPA
jgi:hypothetical protein